MVLSAITGAEMAMRDIGMDIVAGSGVAAAAESLRLSDPSAKTAASNEAA